MVKDISEFPSLEQLTFQELTNPNDELLNKIKNLKFDPITKKDFSKNQDGSWVETDEASRE
jgi:hypothetical protein